MGLRIDCVGTPQRVRSPTERPGKGATLGHIRIVQHRRKLCSRRFYYRLVLFWRLMRRIFLLQTRWRYAVSRAGLKEPPAVVPLITGHKPRYLGEKSRLARGPFSPLIFPCLDLAIKSPFRKQFLIMPNPGAKENPSGSGRLSVAFNRG
jgi:hypothetical protein